MTNKIIGRKPLSNHQKKMSKYYNQERSVDYKFEDYNKEEPEMKEEKVETKTFKFVGYCKNIKCLCFLSNNDLVSGGYECYRCGEFSHAEELLTEESKDEVKKKLLLEEKYNFNILKKRVKKKDNFTILELEKSEVEIEEEIEESEVEIEEEEIEDREELEKINYYLENLIEQEND